VVVNSDSEYVVKTMTLGWKRKANQDLWTELDAVVADRIVRWNWVRGHVGNEKNEMADRLANGAAHGDVVNRIIDQAASDTNGSAARLSHIDESGEARMVDVGDKDVTDRVAVARGRIVMKPETLRLIRENGLEKGDVLGVARTAAVMAAKKTHELIPLCHQIPLTQVAVEFDTSSDDAIEIEATARASWKTGVEMEALTAASVAALTIYDMAKAVDRGMRIESIRVVKKSGGKSGDWEFE
jgi:cyclic pyranopterin phosphate synthase